MNDKTDVETIKTGEFRQVTNVGSAIPMQSNGQPDLLAMFIQSGNTDVESLKELMALKKEYEANEAKKQYVVAMNNFRKACPAVTKTKSGHNCKYAGLAESIDQIKDIMADNGISHRWTTGKDSDGYVLVTCIVAHIGGHEESVTLTGEPDTSGSKNSIQAVGSTVSYLQRYTLFAALGLASSDEDTDGHTVNLAALQDAIRKHFDTIVAVKHGIRDNDLYSAGEAWFELSQDEQKSLWVAPTKGGIFTTEERRIMKEELRKAYYESGDKK